MKQNALPKEAGTHSMVIHVSSFQLISGTVSRMKKAIENKISARIARFTNRAALLDLDV